MVQALKVFGRAQFEPRYPAAMRKRTIKPLSINAGCQIRVKSGLSFGRQSFRSAHEPARQLNPNRILRLDNHSSFLSGLA